MPRQKQIRLCLLASSGGHFEQILLLRPLLARFGGCIMTERTRFSQPDPEFPTHYLVQTNRRELLCPAKLTVNAFRSLGVLLRYRPNVVICTGALATIPMCLLTKLFGGKVIFIESFSKTDSPTRTGRLLHRIADRVYVQWPEMLEHYPNAICRGGIY